MQALDELLKDQDSLLQVLKDNLRQSQHWKRCVNSSWNIHTFTLRDQGSVGDVHVSEGAAACTRSLGSGVGKLRGRPYSTSAWCVYIVSTK